MKNKIIFEKHGLIFLYQNLKTFLFKIITKKSLKLFFLGGDIINYNPMTNGFHEEHIVNLIKSFIQTGYDNFFIDIGSNIGLVSCQLGKNFDFLSIYEPNPICFQISRINLELSNIECNCELNNFGLGIRDENLSLLIPKNNWGGAFIKKSNAYTIDIALGKDGFTSFDEKEYICKNIVIKNAKRELLCLFHKLEQMNHTRGVIKIDVEGYEPIILSALAETIPPNISCYIVFESWDPKFDFDDILNKFNGRAQGFKYERNINKIFIKNKFFKILYIIFAGCVKYSLICKNKRIRKVGDLVIYVGFKNA